MKTIKPFLPFSKKVPVKCSKHPTYDAQRKPANGAQYAPEPTPKCETCLIVYWLRWDGNRIAGNVLENELSLRLTICAISGTTNPSATSPVEVCLLSS